MLDCQLSIESCFVHHVWPNDVVMVRNSRLWGHFISLSGLVRIISSVDWEFYVIVGCHVSCGWLSDDSSCCNALSFLLIVNDSRLFAGLLSIFLRVEHPG